MKKHARRPSWLAVAVALVLLPALASASPVTYTFSGFDTTNNDTWSFKYTAPDFLTLANFTDNGWVSASLADQCSFNGISSCIQLQFLPAGTWYADADVVGINTGGVAYFYFDPGSFDTVGTHNQIWADWRPSTLTVSTPEPAALGLLVAGLLVSAGMMRRKVMG
jgi:hypothetical protein